MIPVGLRQGHLGWQRGRNRRTHCAVHVAARVAIEDEVKRIHKVETAIEPRPGAFRGGERDPACDSAVPGTVGDRDFAGCELQYQRVRRRRWWSAA